MKGGRPLILGSIIPCASVAIWAILARNSPSTDTSTVSPAAVLASAIGMLHHGLTAALYKSLFRYVIGLSIGVLTGVGLGLALGLARPFRLLFAPTIRALQQISLFAWIPLIMAWIGLGEPSKIIFIALSALFPMAIHTADGVADTPKAFRELADVLRLTPAQNIVRVILPAAVPAVFSGLYVSLIYAWMATLASEYLLTSGVGLGAVLINAQEQFQMGDVIVSVAAIAIIGFVINQIALSIEYQFNRRMSE